LLSEEAAAWVEHSLHIHMNVQCKCIQIGRENKKILLAIGLWQLNWLLVEIPELLHCGVLVRSEPAWSCWTQVAGYRPVELHPKEEKKELINTVEWKHWSIMDFGHLELEIRILFHF
jgi:hypothetical protein